jgi:hypothetical protein
MQPKKLIPAAVLIAAAALPLSGCGVVSDLASGSSGSMVYEDRSDANRGSIDLPDWMPEDATMIHVNLPSSGSDYAMRFTSTTGVTPSNTCAASASQTGITPDFSVSWWPEDAPSEDRLDCGDSQVARSDGEWYAWVRS